MSHNILKLVLFSILLFSTASALGLPNHHNIDANEAQFLHYHDDILEVNPHYGVKNRILSLVPHSPINIDGDSDFVSQASNEGWTGDGSLENPFIIEDYEIDAEGAILNCMNIRNTDVHFIIRNCRIHQAIQHGIYLENVNNSKIINNVVTNNDCGIYLFDDYRGGEEHYNIVANNTCENNAKDGISLWLAGFNTIANNTCISNGDNNIRIEQSRGSILLNNTCLNSKRGILVSRYSQGSRIINNTCNGNEFGIGLGMSTSCVVYNNTCTDSYYCGISVYDSGYSTIANNTCIGNGQISGAAAISISTAYTQGYGNHVVANNTCIDNGLGISIMISFSDTVVNNRCDNNVMGIYLHRVTDSTVANNTCTDNDVYQIRLTTYSNNNEVLNNTCIGGSFSCIILAYFSDDNLISNNTCSESSENGIFIDESSQLNDVIWNDFTNNAGENAVDHGVDNFFDYNQYSDYTGFDADGDGIGDWPHPIAGDAGNSDLHPRTDNKFPSFVIHEWWLGWLANLAFILPAYFYSSKDDFPIPLPDPVPWFLTKRFGQILIISGFMLVTVITFWLNIIPHILIGDYLVEGAIYGFGLASQLIGLIIVLGQRVIHGKQ